jgi:signal transduction histidine kinase
MLTATILNELTQPLARAANEVGVLRRLAAPDAGPFDGEAMARSVDRLDSALVRCMLVISRIRALAIDGRAVRSQVTIDAVIRAALRLVETAPGFARTRFEVDAASAPMPLWCDAVQIEQVIANLLSNAIAAVQAQPAPLVRVRAHARSTLALKRMIEVVVTDNGPGVPAGERDDLFQPFHASRNGVTGLGLAICRAIVELHGGRIWHQPLPGGGAAFHFTLPVSVR